SPTPRSTRQGSTGARPRTASRLARMTEPETDLLARAKAAAHVIAPLAAKIEADRRVPDEGVRALVAAGAPRLYVPAEHGGLETPLHEAVPFLAEIARADGSAGWCAMIVATSGLMCAYLEPATAREIFAPANAIACGVFAPTGKSTREGDGYRVTGRWA